uniref:BZIP28 n=1 Tax=Fagopyrum tataricum TaxID=62330 RepID=A0A7D6EKE0_FAGTA|nr:bZIP28 [Fagopyrum tataricum]
MGANMNFRGFGNDLSPGNFSLVRQPSVYSLTFDEFQSTLGKEFGSMNMEELLKNIWSAEETQNTGTTPVDAINLGGYLQRQGSLTLPRTLSLKTVDEVWRDLAKDYGTGKDSANVPPQAQRQPTLGEITLEEFLVRAGVVREDNQLDEKPNGGGYLGELGQHNNVNNMSFGISFQPKQQQQQPIFPKQSIVSCAPSMTIPSSNQLASPVINNRIVGMSDPNINGNMAHVGYGNAGIGVTKSPATLSSDGIKSNGDTSSVSPVPYMFNGGVRGRKSNNTVEKVIERRHRRMIKNRESAARSRARKQAYTMELEQEVAKLKEENEDLKKKQEEFIEMQKNQVLEMMNAEYMAKRRRLTRTLTGPW